MRHLYHLNINLLVFTSQFSLPAPWTINLLSLDIHSFAILEFHVNGNTVTKYPLMAPPCFHFSIMHSGVINVGLKLTHLCSSFPFLRLSQLVLVSWAKACLSLTSSWVCRCMPPCPIKIHPWYALSISSFFCYLGITTLFFVHHFELFPLWGVDIKPLRAFTWKSLCGCFHFSSGMPLRKVAWLCKCVFNFN